jgi:mannose-6-phosphate isomerase-like protein (cupin superfamily)
LAVGQTLDAKEYFEGPWRSFSRVLVDAGTETNFDATDCEYSIFVMSGEGTLELGSTQQKLTTGSAVTVGYRATIRVRAESDLELFVTTLDVDTPSA